MAGPSSNPEDPLEGIDPDDLAPRSDPHDGEGQAGDFINAHSKEAQAEPGEVQ